ATTIEWALAQLGYARAQWSVVIERTLLSLRGWAGMMRQFEERPERAPVRVVPSRLLDYLAVQLMLDVFGQRYALQEALGEGATWAELQRHAVALPRSTRSLPLVYEAFVLAQRLEIELEALLKPAHARAWLGCVQRFGSVERRRMWQLAYERRHRVSVLDALLAHQAWVPEVAPEPVFQAAFCIDDREESLRRHLEETFPAVETFGYAGFYGVAMAYQGLQDPRPRPLCPPAVMPRHLVV